MIIKGPTIFGCERVKRQPLQNLSTKLYYKTGLFGVPCGGKELC